MTTTLTYRQLVTLAYYGDHTNATTLAAIRAFKGSQTMTCNALRRAGLIEPSDTSPYTRLTDLGRQTLTEARNS